MQKAAFKMNLSIKAEFKLNLFLSDSKLILVSKSFKQPYNMIFLKCLDFLSK